MKNKLRNNNDLFNEYDKIIKDYMKEDIAEIIVPSENIVLPDPHIIRETTKARTVFGGSAHSPNEPSTNDVL